jgi:NAD(P)-dependent dehydrogenase (short-subunit alcohol dehydrogenase family)
MRVLVVGATGTLGRPIVQALSLVDDVIGASRNGTRRVDIDDPQSIKAMYGELGEVDAVICAAGGGAWGPLAELTDDDFERSLHGKLMGQVDLVRYGFDNVRDQGSFTLTSGILARFPAPGSAAFSLVNSALEGFVRAAALEAPRGIRINVVSPPWATETLEAQGKDPSPGLPAADIAALYVQSVTGTLTGAVIEAPRPGV